MKPLNTLAIMPNGMKVRVTKNSDPRNLKLFAGYKAVEIIDLDENKNRK